MHIKKHPAVRGASILARPSALTARILCAAALAAAAMPAAAQQTPAPKPAGLLPAPISPQPPSLTPADIDNAVGQLDGIVARTMEETGIPGVAVAVVYGDEVVYEKAFGVREAGKPEPIDTDTVFLVASVSKPIASTVVAGLVGEGVFAFDDPVIGYNPDFALSDPYVTQNATFADLLSHRTGISTGAGDFLGDLGFDRTTILGRLDAHSLDAFRSTSHYSNLGYTAGGEAAAIAAGRPFADVADDVLFEPLGMTRTSYREHDYLAHANRASIHRPAAPGATTWEPTQPPPLEAAAPAGGASSTIADMAKFMRLHLAQGAFDGRQVIDPAALATTQLPHAITSPPRFAARPGGYGLGWAVEIDDDGRVVYGHSGAFNLGTSTNVTLLPGEDLGITVLTNGAPIGVPESIATTFMDIARNGRQTVDWAALFQNGFMQMRAAEIADAEALMPTGDPGTARPLEAYTGTYDNSYYGPATLTIDGGMLVLSLGPEDAPVSLPLTHREGDRFTFETIREWATGTAVAQFAGTAGDKAATVTLSAYDMDDLGTFVRP